MRAFLLHVHRQIILRPETTAHRNQERCNTAPQAKPTIMKQNPMVAENGVAGPGIPFWRRALAGGRAASRGRDGAGSGLDAWLRGIRGEVVGGRHGACRASALLQMRRKPCGWHGGWRVGNGVPRRPGVRHGGRTPGRPIDDFPDGFPGERDLEDARHLADQSGAIIRTSLAEQLGPAADNVFVDGGAALLIDAPAQQDPRKALRVA